jgi:hypothetical protein
MTGAAITTVAHAAQTYVRDYGWSVVPLGAGTKRPLVQWTEYQRRRPDPDRLAAWLAARPTAGLAVVCGAVSGGLVVLDLDEGHAAGVSGRATLAARGVALPAAPAVQTPSGGLHLYLRWPADLPLPRPHAGRTATGEVLPGVDIRGEASYVVAPPTHRRDGQGWHWTTPPRLPLPEAPDWLVRLYAPPTPASQVTVAPAAASPPGRYAAGARGKWAHLLHAPCPPGTRHDTALRIAGWLAAQGANAAEMAAELEAWRIRCCPDHDPADVARIARDIAAKHAAAAPAPPKSTTAADAIAQALATLDALSRQATQAMAALRAPSTPAEPQGGPCPGEPEPPAEVEGAPDDVSPMAGRGGDGVYAACRGHGRSSHRAAKAWLRCRGLPMVRPQAAGRLIAAAQRVLEAGGAAPGYRPTSAVPPLPPGWRGRSRARRAHAASRYVLRPATWLLRRLARAGISMAPWGPGWRERVLARRVAALVVAEPPDAARAG